MRNNLKNARKAKGMTQQNMADLLNIILRQYQRIEAGHSNGVFENWDVLEDTLGIHQRILRENEDNRHALKESQLEH